MGTVGEGVQASCEDEEGVEANESRIFSKVAKWGSNFTTLLKYLSRN